MAIITMREAISQALWEEMERDPKVFILGEEVGVWGGTYAVTKGFLDHFGPDRVRDTPISEAAIVGAAIGSALNGLRPVAELDDDQLRVCRDGSYCQRDCQTALYVQRSVSPSNGHSNTMRRRTSAGCHTFPDPGCDFRAFPGSKSCFARHT